MIFAPLNPANPIADKDGKPTKEFLGAWNALVAKVNEQGDTLTDHEDRIVVLEP